MRRAGILEYARNVASQTDEGNIWTLAFDARTRYKAIKSFRETGVKASLSTLDQVASNKLIVDINTVDRFNISCYFYRGAGILVGKIVSPSLNASITRVPTNRDLPLSQAPCKGLVPSLAIAWWLEGGTPRRPVTAHGAKS